MYPILLILGWAKGTIVLLYNSLVMKIKRTPVFLYPPGPFLSHLLVEEANYAI
jgi:hypothetical protein